MSVLHINEENFEELVLRSDRKVLLDFWAPWCGPCRMIGPVLDEIAAQRPDIRVAKVNVDEEYGLAQRFRVASIPLLVVMKDGQVVQKSLGARPKAEVLKLLEE